MKRTGLIISAALLLLYYFQLKKAEQDNRNLNVNTDDYDFDYNETPFPDDTIASTSIRIRKIEKNTVYVRLFLNLKHSKSKYYYISKIVLNASLFGRYLSFNMETGENGNGFIASGHDIGFNPAMGFGKGTYQYLFKKDGQVTLTDEEIKTLKAAIKDGQAKKWSWAQTDIKISWSENQRGNTSAMEFDKVWTPGIAQGIESYVLEAKNG